MPQPVVEEADYCIVGAGVAGSVLAARLTEDPAIRVAVLEAGPRDWHPWIHIPATCLWLQSDPRFNWLYKSEPVPHAGGRVFKISQGKVVGGSGSINGMLHVRGQPADFDTWAQQGCRGWSYEDLLPFFMRAETYEGGDSTLRGREGPLAVSDFLHVHPLTQAFLDAAMEIGVPVNADMNGARREGAALYQQNRRGRFRANAGQTYLRAARRRPNLRLLTGVTVTRVLFEGRRAVGVAWRRDGIEHIVRARREVLLSAGAIRSPHLLQLSGIGEASVLQGQGIAPLHALAGVGRNLRDHFQVRVGHRVGGVVTLNERTRGIAAVTEALTYAFLGRGMLTMGAGTAAMFHRSREGLEAPDSQLVFAPGSFAGPGVLEREPGMTIGGWPSRPESHGTVRPRGPDPMAHPAIAPDYLSAPEDRRVVLSCLRMIRRMFAAPALARWSRGETFPGSALETDDELLDFARERGTAGLHFTGTCRMGTDPKAVVDPRLRVHGCEALRVVDASVMPNCTVGNTNATVVMVAEKAAAMIREDARQAYAARQLAPAA